MLKVLTDSGGQYLIDKIKNKILDQDWTIDSGTINDTWSYIKYKDNKSIAFNPSSYFGTTLPLSSTSTDSYYPYSYLDLLFPSGTGYDQIGNINDIYYCTFVPTSMSGYGWYVPMASTSSRIRNYRYVRFSRPVDINISGWWILCFEGKV